MFPYNYDGLLSSFRLPLLTKAIKVLNHIPTFVQIQKTDPESIANHPMSGYLVHPKKYREEFYQSPL